MARRFLPAAAVTSQESARPYFQLPRSSPAAPNAGRLAPLPVSGGAAAGRAAGRQEAWLAACERVALGLRFGRSPEGPHESPAGTEPGLGHCPPHPSRPNGAGTIV